MSPEPTTPFAPLPGYATDTVAADAKQAPPGAKARMAGRVVLWRPFGGLLFGHIQDRSGRIQISLRRDELGEQTFKDWSTAVKIGDFIGVAGTTYITNKGEPTLGAAVSIQLTPTSTARRIAAIDSLSSCGPQLPLHPVPPIAHVPSPTVEKLSSVQPNFLVFTIASL